MARINKRNLDKSRCINSLMLKRNTVADERNV